MLKTVTSNHREFSGIIEATGLSTRTEWIPYNIIQRKNMRGGDVCVGGSWKDRSITTQRNKRQRIGLISDERGRHVIKTYSYVLIDVCVYSYYISWYTTYKHNNHIQIYIYE